MTQEYNKNHGATIDYVNSAVVDAWEKMKIWVTTNVDKLDYVQRILEKLQQAYRDDSQGDSAYRYADLIYNAVNDMAQQLRNAGAIVEDDTSLDQFADLIRQVSAQGFEICILGESGTHYSSAEWSSYITEHGTTPEQHACVAVITPYQQFVIGTSDPSGYKGFAWGNTTDSVPGLSGQQVGSFVNVLKNSLNFDSLKNTRMMLMWYDPEVLKHANFDPNDHETNWGQYDCLRFTTKAQLDASNQRLMYDQQIYIVTNDETDGSTNVAYIWNGQEYTKRFSVPRVANNITGSPAAKHAWNYKSWYGEERQYTIPTTNHLLMMWVYFTQINACLSVLNRSALPSSYSWTCQQCTAGSAYYVVPSSGEVSYNSKTNTNAVVPVAAL